MTKIAVASEGKEVSGHFGGCANFNIYEAENKSIIKSESIASPGHKPGFLPNFLGDMGINVVIAGGIGAHAISIFDEKGIKVIAGASGDAQTAAELYLNGSLKSNDSVCHEHMHHHDCGGP